MRLTRLRATCEVRRTADSPARRGFAKAKRSTALLRVAKALRGVAPRSKGNALRSVAEAQQSKQPGPKWGRAFLFSPSPASPAPPSSGDQRGGLGGGGQNTPAGRPAGVCNLQPCSLLGRPRLVLIPLTLNRQIKTRRASRTFPSALRVP
jgi:hypothetical protein